MDVVCISLEITLSEVVSTYGNAFPQNALKPPTMSKVDRGFETAAQVSAALGLDFWSEHELLG